MVWLRENGWWTTLIKCKKWVTNSGGFRAKRDTILQPKTRERGREQKTSREIGKLAITFAKCNFCNDGNEFKSGVWRSRVERNEGCADNKWHEELQKRTEMMQQS